MLNILKDKYLFWMDAETDGLYGSFLSVAVIVTDSGGTEIERNYWGIKPENLKVSEPWVIENVLPIMGNYKNVADEAELLNTFWDFWSKYKENAYAIGDVVYPVESRLFEQCVKLDYDNRMWDAPFPLLDFSTMLLCKGIDPLKARVDLFDGLEGDNNQHNALYDVEMGIAIYKKFFVEGL